MVQLTRIYTRGGDKGLSSLGSGERLSKSHGRFHAIGTVDEANSSVGWCRQFSQNEIHGSLDVLLSRVQNDLFDVGADLCMPDLSQPALRLCAAQVEALEHEIDAYNQHLQPLNSFVLPGGSSLSAALHMARTIVRRAERDVVSLNDAEETNNQVVKYLNRLSDLLFVLARFANEKGEKDVLWVPGANR